MRSDPYEAIRCYYELMRKRTEKRAAQVSGSDSGQGEIPEKGTRVGTLEAKILSLSVCDEENVPGRAIQSGKDVAFELEYELGRPIPDMALTLGVFSETNVKCFESTIPSVGSALGAPRSRGVFRCQIPQVALQPGMYFVNVGLYPTNWDYVFDYHWQMHTMRVTEPAGNPPGLSGVLMVHPEWSAPER